jgi:hypothetical protein
MESEWVVIERYTDEFLCQIAVDLLMDNGIEAVSLDKRERIYRSEGVIELCVHRDNVIAAKEFIKEI